MERAVKHYLEECPPWEGRRRRVFIQCNIIVCLKNFELKKNNEVPQEGGIL